MGKRKSNQELCKEFRALLTSGASDAMERLLQEHELTDKVGQFLETHDMMFLLKPWRDEVWRAFRELEERLCITPEIARRDGLGEKK